ncbi:hypothetical protein Lal_00019040 [Lupinus albus]|nr:hypothetical protein Lal_00019040 [Lupinus albus]
MCSRGGKLVRSSCGIVESMESMLPPFLGCISPKEEVKLTNTRLQEHKAEWKKFGCTIITDGWTNKRRRTILNFLVHSPKGTFFFKSIDESHIAKTFHRIFKMIDEVVEEIREDNVVQVVTNNTSNYKAAGEMLMEKRKKLYWTPCAAHYIDLMFLEFGKIIPIHANTIYTAECKANKFAMTHDERWIEDLVLDKEFWKSIVFALKDAFSLMKVLRLVDSDDYENPPLGLIYEAMD